MRPGVPDVHITDSQDAEFASYKAIVPQAVLGLIFGLLAPLVLVDLAFCIMPLLGASLSWWALRRMNREPQSLIGRKPALIGLAISLIFLAEAPTEWFVHRRLVNDEARPISAQWFKFITQDEPQKAHQLTVPAQSRQPLDDNLWAYYRNSARPREDLEGYVKQPVIRTLLALGPKALVRFYDTASQSRSGDDDVVEQLYAVSYEEDREQKTFFVQIRLLRSKLADGAPGWRVIGVEGGVRPQGW